MASISERVQDLVAEKLDVDKADVVPSASFTDDLNADSLDLVELISLVQVIALIYAHGIRHKLS